MRISELGYDPDSAFAATPVFDYSIPLHNLWPPDPPDNSPLLVTAAPPIAHIRRDLEIRDVYLGSRRSE